MKKILYFILINLFLCFPTWCAESPQLAMDQVQQAIDSHDPELFEKYVDVRSIIDHGVDTLIAEFSSRPSGKKDNVLLDLLSGGLGQHSQSPAGQQIKQLLAEETRKFVIRGVASGSFSGQEAKAQVLPDGGIFALIFADASTARKEFRSINLVSANDGHALVAGQVYDFGSERSYPVLLNLTLQPQGHWQVQQVHNMPELVRMIRQEAENL
ncbi:MAG: hypothetical protein GX043_11540 [Desulfovibrionales bacterium]|nr:hypothetical protein [Desulfovibrionales bacterium]